MLILYKINKYKIKTQNLKVFIITFLNLVRACSTPSTTSKRRPSPISNSIFSLSSKTLLFLSKPLISITTRAPSFGFEYPAPAFITRLKMLLSLFSDKSSPSNSNNSTSKTKVAFGGMVGGDPVAP